MRLDPASIDDVALAGDGGAVVGGEEEHEAGYVFGEDVALEVLRIENALLVGGGHVEAGLAFGEDGSWEDAVDANVVGTEVVCERAGHGCDCGFGHVVEAEVGRGNDVGDGTHVDDGASASGLHAWGDGLGGEKLMAKIDGHALVPVFGCDIFEAMAVVVGGVIDEDRRRGEFSGDVGDRGLQCGDVGDVAGDEEGWVSAA